MSGSELFKYDLLTDEEILWIGQPETNVRFMRSDIFSIPFSLIFLITGIILFVFAVNNRVFYTFLIGLPFFISGVYPLFGIFFQSKYLKKRTYYAVTNKRVLILTNLFSRDLQSRFISGVHDINKYIHKDGIGTIHFGNHPCMKYLKHNVDYNYNFIGFGFDPVPTFYDIKDVDNVCQLVENLRKNK
jgi:hypothetical protein